MATLSPRVVAWSDTQRRQVWLSLGVQTSRALKDSKILVVGINYAPEHTGIAPYTTQACEHLASLGTDVSAIAGVPHYPHWTVPRPYRHQLTTHERRGSVQVTRLRHTVPARQSARRRATYEATFGARVLMQRFPVPDVLLAVVPSLLGAAAAAAHARRANVPLVLWVQDLMGPAAAQSGIAGGGRIARATTRIEGHVLRRAGHVIVVSHAFRGYVQAAGVTADRIHVVPNWSHIQAPRADRRSVRRRLGWRDDEIVALHSGNMGLKQGLENLVEVARLADQGLRVVLMGEGSQRASLEVQAAGVPALQMLPPAEPAQFADVLAAADVLLVNERASAVDMSLPSKLTSYFIAGRPVLAAVPPRGGTAGEVIRSGGGRVIPPEDPKSMLAALLALQADPDERALLGSAGARHALTHLSQEAGLARLVSVLEAALT